MEIPPDSAHVLTQIKTTLRVLGYTNRDLERHLGLSGSYMSRLFSGDMALHFQHILDISRALGLAPQELVMLAYPEILSPPTGEAARRFRALLEPSSPAAAVVGQVEPAAPDSTLVQAVEEVVSALLERMRSRPPLLASPVEVPAEVPPSPKAKRRPGRRKGKPGRGARTKTKT